MPDFAVKKYRERETTAVKWFLWLVLICYLQVSSYFCGIKKYPRRQARNMSEP